MIKTKYIFTAALVMIIALTRAVFPAFAAAEAESVKTSLSTNITGYESEEPGQETEKKGGYFKLCESIRLGKDFKIVLALNCSKANAVNGCVRYNSELLKLEKLTSLAENWQMSYSDSEGIIRFLAVDILLENPIELDAELCELTFSLNENAKEKDILEFSLFDITASELENGDFSVEGSTLNASVERALASDALLHALSVNGGELIPEFSPEIKEYSVTLPYSFDNAEIVTQADEFAKVVIADSALEVGENTVTVTVTSEDKLESCEYVLKITRQRSPDYVESDDSKISSLIIEGGALSGEFSPDKFDYVIYITEGVKSVRLIPTAQSPYAKVAELVIDTGNMGTHKLVCTAENQKTSEYSFTLKMIDESSENRNEGVGNSGDGESHVGETGALLSGSKGLVIGIILLLIVSVTMFFIGFIIPKNGSRIKKKTVIPDKDQEEECEMNKNI